MIEIDKEYLYQGDVSMEMKVVNGKFWILENRANENDIERFVYDDEKSVIDRLRELMKTINTDKLLFSTVDITGKSWNISGVSWAIVAMSLVRGEMSEDTELENIEKDKNSGHK